jgi:hypothetical protein
VTSPVFGLSLPMTPMRLSVNQMLPSLSSARQMAGGLQNYAARSGVGQDGTLEPTLSLSVSATFIPAQADQPQTCATAVVAQGAFISTKGRSSAWYQNEEALLL